MRAPHAFGLLGGLLLAGLLAVTPARAVDLQASDPRPLLPYARMHVRLDVLVDGRPLPLISHAGRLYLAVPRLGAEYTLRVSNDGPRRIAALVSVDGLSVITGQSASDSQPGYLVAGRSNLVIPGWRRDYNTVAAFTFTSREDSYAVRRGHGGEVGVIRLLAIEEQTWRPRPLPILRQEKSRSSVPARGLDARVGETGTGFGRDLPSSVVEVPFVRSTNRRTVTIYYDTAEALRRAGVPVDRPTSPPVPIPIEREFCPPPPR